jgi:two-component system nitrogen regulation sensor histidine kinase NtrY
VIAGRRKRGVLAAVLLVGVLCGIYYVLFQLAAPGASAERDQWLLPTLLLTLVLLTLGLAGVLIRNLVKLIVERRRGILGSQLRIKLVFFFLALVLLPAIVLFSGSVHIIKQSVNAILRTPADHLRRGDEIVAEWRDHFRMQSLRRAAALAEEVEGSDLLAEGRTRELASLLERRVESEQLAAARVVSGSRRLAGAEGMLPPELRPEMERLLDELIAEATRGGQGVDRLDRLGEGLMAQAAVQLRSPRHAAPVVVAVALRPPAGLAESLKSIHEAVTSYQQLRFKRRDLERLYITLIGLIFIATLFVATWVGWYVARRITEPIQEGAGAAREISAGNMDVRVHSRVGDEMAMLVDSFNDMAGELQENREVITRSTAELRRSNRALDERRRYIEILVANLSTAVVSLDPAGRVTTSNPSVERILGLRLDPGDDAAASIAERGLVPLSDVVHQALHSVGESMRLDIELPESAPTQHVSVQITPLTGRSAETLGSLIMVEDLSDLLRAQKALAWQEVARRIAHEIKNPLTPIQLAAQRLRKKFFAKASDLDQVMLESTPTIEHEVRGLKQLVDEFSRFARMPQVEPEQVEFGKIVESVLSLYKGHPGIEWQVDLDPRVGRVNVDVRQIRRAMINLIDNAVSAIDERGTIRVCTRAIGGNGSFRIEVADSGPGIPPGDRDNLFAPYFSTKRRGTGLGLAIVHKVVTDHRGTIRVEDNTPHGARFVIELPA